jgi:hypothetical protein
MSYKAIVCRLKNVREHPNADRLKLADAITLQVIVGLDTKENTIGILFESDGCLSHEMCYENNLYSKSELNKDKTKKSFFGNNRRIRAQNFRGEKSYGFWTELESVVWTGVDLNTLKEGDTFTTLNGKEVCKKYINPATLRHATQNKQKNRSSADKIKNRFSQLKEHFDTKQLRHELSKIPEKSILYITSKCHGTSGRTGNIYAEVPLTPGQLVWNKYFGWIKKIKRRKEYQVVTGTRRVVINPDSKVDNGYYSGKTFRINIHNKIKKSGLPCSATLFYEIVGYDESGKEIMASQLVDKIGDKKLRKEVRKLYGDKITYSYGCKADDPTPSDRYRIYVYRATITNLDGEIYELSWPQVKELCQNLELEIVPELAGPIIYNSSKEGQEAFLNLVESFLDQPEGLDPTHIREGVCVRIEPPDKKTYILKEKGYLFKTLEGILKDDPNVIDTEEAEDLELERK